MIFYLALGVIFTFIIYLIVKSYFRDSGINFIILLFTGLILFSIYIYIGLIITADTKSLTTTILYWLAYSIFIITVINVFLIGYFWSVVRKKTGPIGIRGPSGDNGMIGLDGKCNIDSTEYYGVQRINKLLDKLYHQKNIMKKSDKNNTLFKENGRTLKNEYLNDKVISIMMSNQFKNSSEYLQSQSIPIENLYIYLEKIWSIWFNLIWDANNNSDNVDNIDKVDNIDNVDYNWFLDSESDENGGVNGWIRGIDPFEEIRKYDVYYWGTTETFRPLKAKICQTNLATDNISANVPFKKQPRLKVINSNNYYRVYDDYDSGSERDVSIWRLNTISINNELFYPVGDIGVHETEHNAGRYNIRKKGSTIENGLESIIPFKIPGNGPDRMSILVAGDVKPPIDYIKVLYIGGDREGYIWRPIPPDGYIALGDVVNANLYNKPSKDIIRCVPIDCVEEVSYKAPEFGKMSSMGIWNQNDDWDNYIWSMKNNKYTMEDNGYHLMRVFKYKPRREVPKFYRIKPSCVKDAVNVDTKDLESEFADLGLGWFGKPEKTGAKYSIFAFLGLTPEGIITNQITGHKYYIVHYGGEDINKYVILDSNIETGKWDKGLQVSGNKKSNEVKIVSVSRADPRQLWSIISVNSNTDTDITDIKNTKNKKQKLVKLKSVYNNKFIGMELEKSNGDEIYYSSDSLDNRNYFEFVSAFGDGNIL